eukprot:gene9058-18763_t
MNSLSCAAFILLFAACTSQAYIITTTSRLNHRPILHKMQMALEQQGQVTMYKKNGCPHCAKAVDLLQGKYELNITFVDIEAPEREEILYQMKTFSGGKSTVPQIFFNSDHLGGNSDIQELESSGSLAAKVDIVKSTPVSMMMPHWYHPWY